ncbi:hypothetical protein ACWC6I_05485 [Streptomyces sp. NPDC001414]
MSAVTTEENVRGSLGGPGIDVRRIMPEGFFEIPMDADTLDETAEQLVEPARSVMPEATSVCPRSPRIAPGRVGAE